MKNVLFIFYFIMALIGTQSTLLPMQKGCGLDSEYENYKKLFGPKAKYMVGYAGNISALIELIKNFDNALDHVQFGLRERGLAVLIKLVNSYVENEIPKDDFIKKLEALNNSFCYRYQAAYGEKAAYEIGCSGDIDALAELIKEYGENRKAEVLYDARLGLLEGEFYELNWWVKLYMNNKLTQDELLAKMDLFKNSYCYGYRKLVGGNAFIEIGLNKDIPALIEILKRCGDDRRALELCDIRFGLHQAGHHEFYKLFELYVKNEIMQNELINQLTENSSVDSIY